MHVYDRTARRPVDEQLLFFSGEATLALARAHRITHDAADLEAARRALSYLVGPAWNFFGNRYYFGEEHWTCQAVEELWDRGTYGIPNGYLFFGGCSNIIVPYY